LIAKDKTRKNNNIKSATHKKTNKTFGKKQDETDFLEKTKKQVKKKGNAEKQTEWYHLKKEKNAVMEFFLYQHVPKSKEKKKTSHIWGLK